MWVGGFNTKKNLLPYHWLPYTLAVGKTQTGRKRETLALAVFHWKRQSGDRRDNGSLCIYIYASTLPHFAAVGVHQKRVQIAVATGSRSKHPAGHRRKEWRDRILSFDSRSPCHTNFQPPCTKIKISMPNSIPEGSVAAAPRVSCYIVWLARCLVGPRFAHHTPSWTGAHGRIPFKVASTRAAGPA